MAIPFNWPTEEDTEEYYRRLDQLLADLYDVLRHILLRPRAQVVHPQPAREAAGDDDQEGGEHQGGEPPEPPGGGDGGGADGGDDGGGGNLGENNLLEQRLRPLPDLVANTEAASQNSSVPSGQQSRPSRPPSANVPRPPPRRPRSYRRSSSPRTKSCCSLKVSNSLKSSAENWVLVGEELRKIAEEFRTSFRKEEKTKLTDEQRQVEVKASSLFSLLVPAPFSGPVWTTVILLVGWRLFMRNR